MTKLKYLHAALLLCGLLFAAGCARTPAILAPASDTLETQAAQRAAVEDFTNAARLYGLAAETAQEPRRSKLLLRSADAAAQGGDLAQTQQMLDAISPQSLDEHGQAYFELLQVQALSAGKSTEEALRLLPPPASGTPPDVAAKVWALRAKLFFDDGQIGRATHALVQRDVWLLEDSAIKDNDQTIWDRLRKQPTLADTEAAEGDEITRGWFALAEIGKQVWPDRAALEQELRRWHRRYRGHPAHRHILPERFDYNPAQGTDLRIALALPLSGNFAAAATAIQNGFLAGYYASHGDQQNAAIAPTIRTYDTNQLADANSLILRMRADDISLLVGPLRKSLASEISRRPDLGMPALTLNYTENSTPPPNFYQFGLAPEDEARAAAEQALATGMQTAIALVPEGDWGARILDAFRNSFQSGGGELVDYDRFNPKSQDHAAPIKRLLRYGQQAAPAETADGNTETSRRRGVDFIFLAAQPVQARQIRQQLRFFYASRLPVLATSHVYSGTPNRARDGDLEGLMFADMPWVLGGAAAVEARRSRARDLWPAAEKRYPRLFAMGYDAWLLAAEISRENPQPGFILDGNTGSLYLQEDGSIQRKLDWAQFKRGKPVAVPRAEPTPIIQTSAPENF